MIKYKEYVVLKPDEILRERISKIIEDNNGSVFHEVALNEIIENTFNTQLFYLVDDLKNIKSFSPVHVTKNKFGLKRYHFKPLYDIPYAGFVGSQAVELNKISVGFFESFKYEGFPYKNTIDLNSINTSVGETAMVDLSLDEDEIFSTIIHSKRRNMIRKAMKSGISIKTFQTKEGLDHFWPMLEELHNRLGYEHLTFDYYNKIFENYE